MPVVLDNDAGERVLLYGADGSTLRKVVVDSSGQLVVVGPGTGGAVTVTQTTPASLTVADHGYDGTVWRKQGLIWAYNDRYAEQISNLNAPAAPTALAGTGVPADEVWVVQAIAAWDANNAVGELRMQVVYGGNSHWLARQAPTVANVPTIWYGQIALKQGDYVYALFNAPTLNDDIYLQVAGYKMKIAM